jgi:CheY-like chemotaxis protein
MKNHVKPVHILLVEINEKSVYLPKKHFESSKKQYQCCKKWAEGIRFPSTKKERISTAEKTNLILLDDINIPITNGHEVLERSKK